MIPTLLAAGFIAGLIFRSWWSIAVLTVGWVVVVLVATSPGSTLWDLLVATALAAANGGLGVAVGRGVREMFSSLRAS